MKIVALLLGLVLPLADEIEALKVRATALLELVVKKSTDEALLYVDEESKERFLELWGKGIPSYKIGDIRVTEDRGQVIADIEHKVPFINSMMAPLPMEWVRKDGEWFLHIPDWDRTITPFGKLGPSNSNSPQGVINPLGGIPPMNVDLIEKILSQYNEERAREQEAAAKKSTQPSETETPAKSGPQDAVPETKPESNHGSKEAPNGHKSKQ